MKTIKFHSFLKPEKNPLKVSAKKRQIQPRWPAQEKKTLDRNICEKDLSF
jgi:hypothetical protein